MSHHHFTDLKTFASAICNFASRNITNARPKGNVRKSQFSLSFYILSCCFSISPWCIVYTHDLLNVRLSINFKSILGPEKPRNHYSFKIYRIDHLFLSTVVYLWNMGCYLPSYFQNTDQHRLRNGTQK